MTSSCSRREVLLADAVGLDTLLAGWIHDGAALLIGPEDVAALPATNQDEIEQACARLEDTLEIINQRLACRSLQRDDPAEPHPPAPNGDEDELVTQKQMVKPHNRDLPPRQGRVEAASGQRFDTERDESESREIEFDLER